MLHFKILAYGSILYYHWKMIIVPRESAVRWRKEPLPAETVAY